VVAADNFGLFVTGVLVIVGLLALAISAPTVGASTCGRYHTLMLFALAGMMLMATASDLLVIFLALEVMSLSLYVLTGIRRDSPRAAEGAFKYFLLGAFSSAFFVYGIAFAYGAAGSTRLDRIGRVMAAQALAPNAWQLAAVGLLLVGFAFKVSAVPFHMWTPDAYEAAPPAVTGFMSTGVKAAAFAAFTRVFLSAFEPLAPRWRRTGLGRGGCDNDSRDRCRGRADQREAHARVEHRARQVSAGGPRIGQRHGQGRRAFLRARVRAVESRGLRRRRPA
jgi:NADH-quinone oxidoreductase subunit N